MAESDAKVLTAHLPVSMPDKIDLFAKRLERSRGWIMKQALLAWIDQQKEHSRLTREALMDVGSGSVIDHKSAQTWAESLSTESPAQVPR
jgi:predicted transcriptional regulator